MSAVLKEKPITLSLPLNPERIRVVKWARQMLQEGAVILDSETTGLKEKTQIPLEQRKFELGPEMIEIALIYIQGKNTETLMNQRVRPVAPGHLWTDATKIHGIQEEDLKDCPQFPEVYINTLRATTPYNNVVIYNRTYDVGVMKWSARAHGFTLVFPKSQSRPGALTWPTGAATRCAQKAYAAWVGQYKTTKTGQPYKNPTFQKLPNYGHGAHSAIGDCLSTADLIRDLAGVEI